MNRSPKGDPVAEAQVHQPPPGRTLAEADQLLGAIIESSDDAILSKDLNGTITSWNAGAERLFGYTADEIIGKPVNVLIPENRRDEEPGILDRVRQGLRIDHYETIRRRKDGTFVDVSLSVSPVKDSQGRIVGASKVARDITDRKQVERIRRLLSAIVESSDDGIASKDLNGIITSWNKGAERLLGYKAEEIIGRPVTLLIPEERLDEEPEILRRIRSGERVDHFHTVRRRKDGSRIDVSLTISPIKDEHGKVVGASKILRDITEQKRAEERIRRVAEELRKAQEQLSRHAEELEKQVDARTASLRAALAQLEEFSYSVSHDLRAPLRAIAGYAELLRKDHGHDLNADAQLFLGKITRNTERMQRLVNDVLTISRIGRAEMRLHPIGLQRFIEEIAEQDVNMQEPAATLSINTPHRVVADDASLGQAVSNLLTNAVKFVAAGQKPVVAVRSEEHQGRVRVWFEDNGIGIKPEHHAKLFAMFQRLTSDPRYEGLGIGLAIVRKAVERMGGSAGIESGTISGSRFWIELQGAP